MANVSKLLHNNSASCLTNALDLSVRHDTKLREARKDIRNHLRAAFRDAQKNLLGSEKARPGFYTQGSYAYKTINLPAHTPPQQIDLDDGIYLPVSFLENAGQPKRVADQFIDFVDNSLRVLAQSKGWEFRDDKPTCARLILDDETHVDVPMYAIPDKEMLQLQKKALARSYSGFDGAVHFNESMLDDNWSAIPTERVNLAHRNEGWITSDPRVIKDWFDLAVSRHGEELRRVCRYLKAWRDHQSVSGGSETGLQNVSSIFLMACAVEVYDTYYDDDVGMVLGSGREDEALRYVVQHLPNLISNGLPDPADTERDLTDRLSVTDRRYAVDTAREFGRQLTSAIDNCQDAHLAVEAMISILGGRIPQRPDLVHVSLPSSPRAIVEREEPAVVAAPFIERKASG